MLCGLKILLCLKRVYLKRGCVMWNEVHDSKRNCLTFKERFGDARKVYVTTGSDLMRGCVT